jgi:hexosaminidase
LWHDAGKVVMHAPTGASDELQLHLDRCDGRLIAAVPLPAARQDARTVEVAVNASAVSPGPHDICLYFAARSTDPLRLIDWVEPVPRGD